MRYWNLTWALPATIAIGGIWGVSACANWYFGASLGTSQPMEAIPFLTTAMLFSGASLFVDMLKMLALFGTTAAVLGRAWSAAVVTALIWLACAAWSVASAVGFVAVSHSAITDIRGKDAEAWAQLRNEIARTEERRSWIPQHRPIDTVRAEISGIEADYTFLRSRRCTDVTAADSAATCKRFALLKQEEGNAAAAATLDAELKRLRDEL